MSIEQMRDTVISAYPGSPKWKARVLRMTDAQVFVIYQRITNKK